MIHVTFAPAFGPVAEALSAQLDRLQPAHAGGVIDGRRFLARKPSPLPLKCNRGVAMPFSGGRCVGASGSMVWEPSVVCCRRPSGISGTVDLALGPIRDGTSPS